MGGTGNQMVGGEGGAGPISKLHNNKQRGLGLVWSMYEVGTPPPHNLDKPHGLVASINNNKNIKQIIKGKNYINEMEIICRPLRQLWHKTEESPAFF